jgi:hypothetical protein
MVRIAASGQTWHMLPAEYGKPDTVSRHFRRLARMGLWMRLVDACANRAAPRHRIVCRPRRRRAMRALGLDATVMAEKLGLPSAMPVPPVHLTQPHWFDQAEQAPARLLLRDRAHPPRVPVPDANGCSPRRRFPTGKPRHRRRAAP